MAAKRKSGERYLDADLLAEFVREATAVSEHPETAKVPPALMRLTVAPDQLEPFVEVPLDEVYSWQHLAISVRKLVLLPGEPLYVPNVLNTLAKTRTEAREDVSSLLRDIRRWEKTALYFTGDMGKLSEKEKLPYGQTRFVSLTLGDAATDYSKGMTNKLDSIQLADIFINGKMFHGNPEHVRTFEGGTPHFKAMCQQSAQYRIRGGAYWIVRALRVLEKHGTFTD